MRRAVPVLLGLSLFAMALGVLRSELRAVSWHAIVADVVHVPASQLALAALFTALNYAALTCYDLLAFAYIGRTLSRGRIVLASFLAYAISNNVGFAMLSGASVRYRFYTRWGLTAGELSRIVFSYSVTFWLGLVGLGGLSLVTSPVPVTPDLPLHGLLVPAGWILMLAPALYLIATFVRQRPLAVGRFRVTLPSPRIAFGQAAISMIDWALAGAVLYALLPKAIGFVPFLGAFLLAILLGMASHVPGGVGVFEGLMVLLLKPSLSSGELLPALVVYRAVYYLLPFVIALALLIGDEAWHRRAHAARLGAVLGRVTEQLTPRVLATVTFLSGVVLLVSGATPAAAGRLQLLARIFPLGVIEASHFVGSVAGVLLLILSQGLARRLDAAYYFTVLTIAAGVVASLLKGFDYEEAIVLALVLGALQRARPAFTRRAAFFDTRFSAGWMAALAGALGASLWLGFFAFKHVDYSSELWWQFELHSEASRFLRASVGASLVVLLFGFARLVGFAPHEAPKPSPEELDQAAAVIRTQTSTVPYLAWLGDKTLLFNDDRSGFVMYGVQGRTWVALGDPVGPEDRLTDLIRRFLERCDDFGGTPVFYEVGRANLHRYADFGLTFVKLGEEARVDLEAYSLEGGNAAKHRQAIRRLEKEGRCFRVVPPEDVHTITGELRQVSDDWLASKGGGEKGFSLGFFDDAYVSRFPVAVIEHDGRIEAFANLWPGARHVELSIDLMRYRHDAPKSIMETLMVHVILWGKAQGYRWFALGMAPLSGFEESPVGSIWHRLGALVYAHGEAVYNFQGLRAYKEKFHPVWEPRYLAYPGGLRLPRIMADVSALIAGGYAHIFRR